MSDTPKENKTVTDVKAVISAAASMLPVVNTMLAIVGGAQASGVVAAIEFAEQLLPVANDLFASISSIRSQTIDQYPEVWEAVSTHWDKTFARAQSLGLA